MLMHNPPDDRAVRPEVIAAGPSDAARVIDMLMLAFAADPPNRWLFPDAHDYVRNFPKFVQGLGGSALRERHRIHDVRLFRRDLVACARCQPGRGGTLAPHRGGRCAGQADGARRRDRPDGPLPSAGAALVSAVHRRRSQRGRGRGLAPRCCGRSLARCDEAGLPAYLESSNPRNRPLYQRHGFEVHRRRSRSGSCPPVSTDVASSRASLQRSRRSRGASQASALHRRTAHPS